MKTMWMSLFLLWTGSAFATDYATIYLHDQNERTIIATNVYATDPTGGGSGQGYELIISDDSAEYDFGFSARRGDSLAIRSYENARPSQTKSVIKPSLEVKGGGLTCQMVNGSFQVLELTSAAGALTKFSADFIASCVDGTVFEGAVRFNSDLAIVKPIAIAPAPPDVISTIPNLIYLDSPVGDAIGGGKLQRLGNKDGYFSVVTDQETVEMLFEDQDYIRFTFSPVIGHKLAVGHYDNAGLYESSQAPALEVVTNTHSCGQVSGSFDILEIQRNATDASKIDSFAANLTQSCDGGPSLKSSIRFNSTIPAP